MAQKTSTPASPGFDALKWRCIGPSRGGRVVAVSGDPLDRMTFYFGACAGGIWKTVDGGVFWRCVSALLLFFRLGLTKASSERIFSRVSRA